MATKGNDKLYRNTAIPGSMDNLFNQVRLGGLNIEAGEIVSTEYNMRCGSRREKKSVSLTSQEDMNRSIKSNF